MRETCCPPAQVITEELFRNLALACAAVFAATFVLLADVFACVLVLAAVGLTLLDVAGLMHFWGERDSAFRQKKPFFHHSMGANCKATHAFFPSLSLE